MGRRQESGAKGVALQTSSATCRYPGVMGLYPGPPEKGGRELGPNRNQTRPEPEFEFSTKRRWSVSNPQLRLRPFNQIPVSRTGGLEKRGRIGRVKERNERGQGREGNIVSYSLPVGALWPVVRVRRRPGTKEKGPSCSCWVWSIGRRAGPSTPSGQDVSLSEEESHQSCHLLQEGGPLPGPKTGLLSNTRKWTVRGDTCANKQEILLGKGARVESRRVREPRRTSLSHGLQSRVLWWWD